MTRSMQPRPGWIGFLGVVAIIALAGTAMAQEEPRSQVNVQMMGLFTKTSNGMDVSGNPITDQPTKTGGILAGYTLSINRWAAVEGNYGFSQNSQNYSGLFGNSSVQTHVHEATGAFVLRLPVTISKLGTYALAGTGVVVFHPAAILKDTMDLRGQGRAAFLYGAGINYSLSRNIGLRAEYRGLVMKAPDFQLSQIDVGATTHIAQPSVGVFFRF